jgi:hypothetical protein
MNKNTTEPALAGLCANINNGEKIHGIRNCYAQIIMEHLKQLEENEYTIVKLASYKHKYRATNS